MSKIQGGDQILFERGQSFQGALSLKRSELRLERMGESVPTKFDGVLIENNEIRNISGVGIRTKSTWEHDTR